jgi:hypothetical protein
MDLKTHRNRFNGVYGAGIAAERSGNKEKSKEYFKKLLEISEPTSKRPVLQKAKPF